MTQLLFELTIFQGFPAKLYPLLQGRKTQFKRLWVKIIKIRTRHPKSRYFPYIYLAQDTENGCFFFRRDDDDPLFFCNVNSSKLTERCSNGQVRWKALEEKMNIYVQENMAGFELSAREIKMDLNRYDRKGKIYARERKKQRSRFVFP